MTEIDKEDIVVLGRQLCIVIGISEPFSTTSPLDFDQSQTPKKAIQIAGRSLFWPKIEYQTCFLLHDDNKIGIFSGTPEIFEASLVIPKTILYKIV